jgi:hypothetical protein
MEEIQTNGAKKYLDMYYGDMITSEYNGRYKTLNTTKSSTKIFIYEEKTNFSYVNSKYVIEPIMKVFQTEYNETYDFVKDWFEKKYGYNCDDLIGF